VHYLEPKLEGAARRILTPPSRSSYCAFWENASRDMGSAAGIQPPSTSKSSEKPKAKSQKPKAKSQKPKAKSQKPKAKSQKPRTEN